MNIEKIKERVDEIAKSENIHDQEVYNRILAYLETTYNYTIPAEDELEIISDIKTKILKTLYSKAGHKQGINRQTKYNELFDLDGIEIKYLDQAFQDLETNGQVASLMYEISLTEKGIMTIRNS
jgi:hypothetical protein